MSTVRVFTRQNPCSKVDLWNCFGPHFASYVPIVNAKAIIGENAPKYLLREKFITQTSRGGVDYYFVTAEGRAWLLSGVRRYLSLHPEDAAFLTHPVPGVVTGKSGTRPAARIIRRVHR